MNILRIVLVDDHEIVRMGLRTLLEDIPDVQIVAEASSAQEALTACEQHHPNLVIMDIRMPGESGIEACHRIIGRWPDIQVIILTSYADDRLIADAIQAGAIGYLLKNVGMDDLLRALEAVKHGDALLDPTVTRHVLAMIRNKQTTADNPLGKLTERELEVLHLVAQGYSNTQIVKALVVSDKTVRNYISTILDKLNVQNRMEAAQLALSYNIANYRHGGDRH